MRGPCLPKKIRELFCSQVECVNRSNIERATPQRRSVAVGLCWVIEVRLERAATPLHIRGLAAVRINPTTIDVDAVERRPARIDVSAC